MSVTRCPYAFTILIAWYGCTTKPEISQTDPAGEYREEDPLYGMRFTDNEVAGVEKMENENGKQIKINLNDPMMPVAWTKTYQIPGGKKGKVFTQLLERPPIY